MPEMIALNAPTALWHEYYKAFGVVSSTLR